MNIYIPCYSAKREKRFLEIHPFLEDNIRFIKSPSSLFKVINEIIANENSPCLFMHDDLYVDKYFLNRVQEGIEALKNRYPKWGVAGNCGVGLNLYGLSASPLVRYIIDLQGAPNLPGRIIPAKSIDGNCILLNVPALKKYKTQLPDFQGYHLYDLILSIETIKSGLGCFIIPQLLCFHESKENQASFDACVASDSFKQYLSDNIKNNRLTSTKGDINVNDPSGSLDIQLPSPGHEAGRSPSVAIVVRTQFLRKELLFRTVSTIKAFIAASGKKDMYKCYIVTDKTTWERGNFLENVSVLNFTAPEELEDTRLFLIKKAAENITCDYFWFIDDDDWLFPNMAKFLSLSIISSPLNCTFFIGASQYREDFCYNGSNCWPCNSKTTGLRYFNPRQFAQSISGVNYIPFCGIIFPVGLLKKICYDKFANIIYLEDYLLELLDICSQDFFPIIIDKLLVGISVREEGNTVTEKDRKKWYMSNSAMFSDIIDNCNMLINLHYYTVSISPASVVTSGGNVEPPTSGVAIPPLRWHIYYRIFHSFPRLAKALLPFAKILYRIYKRVSE